MTHRLPVMGSIRVGMKFKAGLTSSCEASCWTLLMPKAVIRDCSRSIPDPVDKLSPAARTWVQVFRRRAIVPGIQACFLVHALRNTRRSPPPKATGQACRKRSCVACRLAADDQREKRCPGTNHKSRQRPSDLRASSVCRSSRRASQLKGFP